MKFNFCWIWFVRFSVKKSRSSSIKCNGGVYVNTFFYKPPNKQVENERKQYEPRP